jgi:phosphatidylinositol alpha-1,6-mannosyltransferase
LIERKGVDMVLATLPSLRAAFPSVLYVVVGEGDRKEALERKAMELGLREYVTFLGRVSDAEKHALYEECELFVLPNRESGGGHVEGFGIVFLEAALHGKPVIAGNSGGTADAVLDGVTGVLVDPYSHVEISRAIYMILDDAQLAQKLGNAGKLRVLKDFTWQRSVSELLSLLQPIARAKW